MPIRKPGERFRYHRILSRKKGKRSVTALLSLTAMVDMFTVLAIFLLQNYNVKDFIVYTPKEVVLPKAQSTKELKPAFVITISSKEILLDKTPVASFDEVKGQTEWLIQALYDQLQQGLVKSKQEYESKLQSQLKNVVDNARGEKEDDPFAWKKITIQSDKDIDFLTVKKVMYTVSEAGAGEINFAVVKKTDKEIAK
ncbi:MAG: biopolymer transporter ExbD [Bdellovibrionaceae bacterium]|nr:biopolymer transporter ExbD [Pseudobdellovibrionaceae bacterium]